MTQTQMSHCASCGEPIYWLNHDRTLRPAPIEYWASPVGNILVDLDAGTYHMLTADERAAHTEWLHLNHFAACPQARIWSKAGRV